MPTSVGNRVRWRKKREYLLASAGCAVGFGNVWRFPYLCYKNGGGVFLLPYCFFATLCGVPLFLLETVIGQYTQDSLWLCVLNSCTSFVAGFAVFSVLGFMSHKQGIPMELVVESGPGLAFIAFPQAVAMMPLPQLWAAYFFLMIILLGLDTLFAGLETITSCVIDRFPGQMRRPWRREIFLIFFCSLVFIIQISLTAGGGVYQFQLLDYYGCSGASVMFVCIFQCVAVSWAFGADRMCDAVENRTGQRPWSLYRLCWRYFTPLICTVCFIGSFIEDQTLTSKGGYVYPDWAYRLGWAVALSSVVPVPIYAAIRLCLTKGTFRQRLQALWRPAPDLAYHTTDPLGEQPEL